MQLSHMRSARAFSAKPGARIPARPVAVRAAAPVATSDDVEKAGERRGRSWGQARGARGTRSGAVTRLQALTRTRPRRSSGTANVWLSLQL